MAAAAAAITGKQLLTGAAVTGGIIAGSQAISTEVQRKQASKEASRAREQQRKLLELEAGEYDLISKKQMEIQAMQSQTRTLVELLDKKSQPAAPQIYTLPVAQSTRPLDRINAAIDDFIKGVA